MNRTLLLALMIAGSALSAAQAQTSPRLASPTFPLDSSNVPDDSSGGATVVPPSLPSPSAPGLPTLNSPSPSGSYLSGRAGVQGGSYGGATVTPPTNAMPPAMAAPPTISPRPNILTQPPGAGIDSGTGINPTYR